jgi:hypothetical protein
MPMLNSQAITLTRLFSAAVVRQLAQRSKSPLFGRISKELRLWELLPIGLPLRDVFDDAFEMLKSGCDRSEYIYKVALTQKVLLGRHSLRTAVMLPEFRVGKCKADIAILNGTSTVYEIKSERDRLDRLATQLNAYLQVFAAVNVLTAETHVKEILATAPLEVGILVLTDRFQISSVREAFEEPKRIRPDVVFGSLRSSEAREILRLAGIDMSNVPNTQLRLALHERFLSMEPEQVHSGMVTVLRKTRSHLRLRDLIDGLPISLRAAALSTPLRQADFPRLVNAMNTPFAEALSWV